MINGGGYDEFVKLRMDVLKSIQDIDKIQSLDAAQKAKIKWSIEGDENSSFYHGVLNKKRSQLNIRGILVDGTWVDNPQRVKNEFLHHFSKRFDKPAANRASLVMNFENLSVIQQVSELEVSKDEVKRAVWDCGTDKAPGPDGFTFGFYRRFWKVIENECTDALIIFLLMGTSERSYVQYGCGGSLLKHTLYGRGLSRAIHEKMESGKQLKWEMGIKTASAGRHLDWAYQFLKISRWWDITYIEADSYEDWLNWLVNLCLSSNYKQALKDLLDEKREKKNEIGKECKKADGNKRGYLGKERKKADGNKRGYL
ncbi:hypothetical protein Tco_0648338 [Tanacetum coccineum]